jgi:hypothetical protein
MKITKNILFFILAIVICITSCKKIGVGTYSKDGLTLKLATVSGKQMITWDAVNTSDFKRYEVYASGTNDIDVVKNTDKLVATITSADKNKFEAASIILDSNMTGGKIYYKVAAVLTDRKVASNSIEVASDIIFSSSKYSYSSYIPLLNKIFLANNTTGTLATLDLNTKQLQELGFGSTGIIAGTNASSGVEFIFASSSSCQLYNVNDFSLLHNYFYSNLNITGSCLVKGFIYLSAYNSQTGTYGIYIYNEADNSYVTYYPSNDPIQNMVVSLDQKSMCCTSNFGTAYMFTIGSNGALTQTGNTSAFSSAMPVLNKDGSKIILGGSGTVYNKSLSAIGSINNFSSVFSFSDNNNYIAAPSTSITNSVEIFKTSDYSVLSTINFEVPSNLSLFNTIPIFNVNELYVASTLFNNQTGLQTFIIFKRAF